MDEMVELGGVVTRQDSAHGTEREGDGERERSLSGLVIVIGYSPI